MNENKQDPIPNQQQYSSYSGSGQDEINLLDIWQGSKRQWKLIVSITSLITLGALIATLMMPNVYKAEVVLLPPEESDVEALNIPDLYEITADELYQKMLRNLKSNELRYRFFNKHKLFAALETEKDADGDIYKVFTSRFNNRISVKESVVENKELEVEVVSVMLEGPQPEQVASWLNEYVAFVETVTLEAVYSAIDSKITVQETNIQRQMDSLRTVAEKQRLDYIAYLNEAIYVADKLGLNEQDTPLYTSKISDMEKLGIVLSSTEMPLYTRGSIALRAKVEAMEKRKNDDPFIDGLREFEGELSYLGKIRLDKKGVHAARLDQQAIADTIPIKPKRKLIVVLSILIGSMLAVIIAMIRNFFILNPENNIGKTI